MQGFQGVKIWALGFQGLRSRVCRIMVVEQASGSVQSLWPRAVGFLVDCQWVESNMCFNHDSHQ